jgi:hypothetical protein
MKHCDFYKQADEQLLKILKRWGGR